MGRLTRFPDLREFRARAAGLGQATGPVESAPDSARGTASGSPAPWMWVGLAAVAMVSLTWLGWSALSADGDETVLARRDDLDAVVAEIRAAQERLEHLETELAALRSINAAVGEADADLTRRVSAIEEALGARPRLADTLLGERRLYAGADDVGSTPRPREFGEPRAILPDVARLSEGTLPPPEATGSVGGGQSGFPSYAFAVDLGGFATVDDLKRYWSQLVTDNPLLLSDLAPHQVTQIEPDGARSYRLIAGPVDNVDLSKRICAALRLRGASCRQTIHAGERI